MKFYFDLKFSQICQLNLRTDMGIEIERKFLVDLSKWEKPDEGVYFSQAYLVSDSTRTVRVRIAGKKGYLTIKGKSTGISRKEFEYEIPLEEAKEMLRLCNNSPIEKVRYFIEAGPVTWEVDEFQGSNQGLVMAEVELKSEDQEVELPPWILKEVSGDKRFFNSYLSVHPYPDWKDAMDQ